MPPQPPVRTSRLRRLRRPVALLLVSVCGLWLAVQWLTWPDVPTLAREIPSTTAFIERYRQEQQGGKDGAVDWIWVPYEAISPHLKRAVVVAEDIGFFSHQGFALEELEQAVREAITERQPPRGASTITQQLAKNLWLSPSRSPWRKLKEALLTRQLERELSKRRILELYLNVVEHGPGIYGAEAASRHFFGKPAVWLSPSEAAQLAAGLPRPRDWHPGSTSSAYRRHVERIEARMARANWLWKVI